MRTTIRAAILAALAAVPAAAEGNVTRYTAFIGIEDLYNSNGDRLTKPWQILRQDRANVHRYNIRHSGDQRDSYFTTLETRSSMERLLRDATISADAAERLVAGGVAVEVEIDHHDPARPAISVTVL